MRAQHHPGWVVLAAASCFGLALSGTVRSQAPADTRDKAASARPISFNRDIRPILANNCFACHGPDEKQRETKFHFDTRDGAFLADQASSCRATPPKSLLDPADHQRRSGRAHAAARLGHALTDTQIALLHPLDRRRRQMGHALGLRRADARPSCRP